MASMACKFCQKHQNLLTDVFFMSLGALINHKNFQSDSSTPSWSKWPGLIQKSEGLQVKTYKDQNAKSLILVFKAIFISYTE